MAGPLEGLLVIDASWGMPGSVTTMLLADYGARVLKIERPGGGPDRNGSNLTAWNRGKWSIEADLRDPAGLGMMRALMNRTDVFVESGRPGVAATAGYGYEVAHATNPMLVYTSISPYGQDDTPWRDRPGWDSLVAARMGFMAEQPGHRDGPIFLGHPSVGYTTALLATIGTLAALRARHVTGLGQQVDVSILDGVLGQAPMNWWWNERDDSYLTTTAQGTFGHRRVIIEMFMCSDGEYVMVHTGGDGAFKATMDILGLGENIRVITGKPEIIEPLNDEEFHDARVVAPEVWKTRTRDEWLGLLKAADVAAVPVMRPGQVLDHEQVRFAGVEVPACHDNVPLRQIGPSIRFARTPAGTPTPAPSLGEHNDCAGDLLAMPALADAQGAGGHLDHALQGIKVLDLSQYFAAAYGVKKFSDLGADVIKIETPARDPMRALPDPFEGAQRGKRSITVDLTTEAGRQVVYDLVRQADIVVHNLRPGKAEKIGIGYEDLSAINSKLIYCYQPGWGADGPSKNLKSFAPLMSGMTGLMYEAAGDGNEPVRRARASEDYYGALMGAFAMLMALHHRDKTGEGQYLESPQLHSSLLTTTEQQLDENGNLVTDNHLDNGQFGYHALYRLYRTSDSWICLAAVGDRAFSRLREALDVAGLNDDRYSTGAGRAANEEGLAKLLGEHFESMTAEDARKLLESHDVPCEIALDQPFMPQFFWEEWAVEAGRVFEHHHEEFGWIREVGLVIRLSDTPGLKKGPAPMFSEHTHEVLSELGYPDERIAELAASGAVVVRQTQG